MVFVTICAADRFLQLNPSCLSFDGLVVEEKCHFRQTGRYIYPFVVTLLLLIGQLTSFCRVTCARDYGTSGLNDVVLIRHHVLLCTIILLALIKTVLLSYAVTE